MSAEHHPAEFDVENLPNDLCLRDTQVVAHQVQCRLLSAGQFDLHRPVELLRSPHAAHHLSVRGPNVALQKQACRSAAGIWANVAPEFLATLVVRLVMRNYGAVMKRLIVTVSAIAVLSACSSGTQSSDDSDSPAEPSPTPTEPQTLGKPRDVPLIG